MASGDRTSASISRERTTKLRTARTLSTETSSQSNRCRCSRMPVQAQQPPTGSSSASQSQRRRRQTSQPTTAKERRKSLQRSRPIYPAAEDEIQVEVEMIPNNRPQLTSDGDDTLNNLRLPSLEKDDDAVAVNRRPRDDLDDEEDPLETEPLLIEEVGGGSGGGGDTDSVVIEIAQHER